MAMKIQPNVPLSCVYLGISATYQPRCGGGYEVRFKLSDIPEGHEFYQSACERDTRDRGGWDDEVGVFLASLDISDITDVAPGGVKL